MVDRLDELLFADALCREYQAWLPLEDVDDAVEDEDEPDE